MKTNPTKRQVRDALRQLAAFAPDAEKARTASASLGLDKPERVRASPVRRPGASESQVLTAVLGYLRRHPAVAKAWRNNVGAFEVDQRYIAFGFAGLSDVSFVMKGGRAGFVEVKRERGGRVSEAQQKFIDEMRAAGAIAGVVTSVDELQLLLKYATAGVSAPGKGV